MDILIATGNRKKIEEITSILSASPEKRFNVLSISDLANPPDVVEDGATFEENAVKKAQALWSHSRLLTIADDSGLSVDALGGRPGVYSARYGGSDLNDEGRCRLLLEEMKDSVNRSARFVCCIAVVSPDGAVQTARGECEGEITLVPSGNNGFGYDPVFFVKEYNATMAELNPDIKNTISHRAAALRKALPMILALADER